MPGINVCQYFSSEFKGEEVLTPAEKSLTVNWSAKRIRDFSTGRFCASKALEHAGITERHDILTGNGKGPVWPLGIVGTISHSDKLTGALVNTDSTLLSIGLDIETIGKVEPDMWNLLFVPTEQAFLKALPEAELARYTTLLFSMKESFYKLQFPLTKTFLDFTDVEACPQGNLFGLKILRNFEGKNLLPHTTPIYFNEVNDQILTFCYLEK